MWGTPWEKRPLTARHEAQSWVGDTLIAAARDVQNELDIIGQQTLTHITPDGDGDFLCFGITLYSTLTDDQGVTFGLALREDDTHAKRTASVPESIGELVLGAVYGDAAMEKALVTLVGPGRAEALRLVATSK